MFYSQFKWLWLGLLYVVLQHLPSVVFANGTVSLVSSNSHFAMVHRIESALLSRPNAQFTLNHIVAENVSAKAFLPSTEGNLIVTIGAEALAAVLKTKTQLPILSVLIRKHVFHQLLKEYHLSLSDPKQPITAIYLDQPLIRQLYLLRALFPNQQKQHIGVLLGRDSINDQQNLRAFANHHKLELTTVYVSKFENPIAVLDGLLNEADVVLALPDNRIYNPRTARGILLTAFHKRVPLIGYSNTFVNNGAIAAVYSSTKQIAEQTADQILVMSKQKSALAPPPESPKAFTIAVNYQVARSLGIAIESEASLKYAIDKMEKANLSLR